jgi:hypothetical protein
MRDTSLEAYQQLTHLNSKQQTVLKYIRYHPDSTDHDIAVGLAWAINTVTPRRGELEKYGLIASNGKVVQNRRKAYIWRVRI